MDRRLSLLLAPLCVFWMIGASSAEGMRVLAAALKFGASTFPFRPDRAYDDAAASSRPRHAFDLGQHLLPAGSFVRAVAFAIGQPEDAAMSEILFQPARQELKPCRTRFGFEQSERSMKPYVICQMVTSVDGRTLTRRWRPQEARQSGLLDRLHERLGGDASLVGRVTGREYARLDAYPDHTDQSYPKAAAMPTGPFFARG